MKPKPGHLIRLRVYHYDKMCGLTYDIEEVCPDGSEPQKVYKEGEYAKTTYALL